MEDKRTDKNRGDVKTWKPVSFSLMSMEVGKPSMPWVFFVESLPLDAQKDKKETKLDSSVFLTWRYD
jgi:hypothetical protein